MIFDPVDFLSVRFMGARSGDIDPDAVQIPKILLSKNPGLEVGDLCGNYQSNCTLHFIEVCSICEIHSSSSMCTLVRTDIYRIAVRRCIVGIAMVP